MTILLIGHDANRAGAQLVLLNLMRLLKAKGIQMHLLLGEGGPLLSEYEIICPVTLWPVPDRYVVGVLTDKVLGKLGLWERFYQRQIHRQQQDIRARLAIESVDLVLVNTVMSGRWFGQIDIPDRTPVITFVHELAMSVRTYTRPGDLAHLLHRTTQLLAVSKATARYYEQEHNVDPTRILLYTLIDTPRLIQAVGQARQQPDVYAALNLPEHALIVGGCGNAEWRKGNDLFVSIARQVIDRESRQPSRLPADIHFVWVGMPSGSLRDDLLLDIKKAGLAERIHLIPPTPDVLRYMARFDVFVLCSREDPYPLVMFEAGLSEVPVVCFDGAGGAPELIGNDGGYVVPYLDLDAMSNCLLNLLHSPNLRQKMGRQLAQTILERHPAQQSVETLVTLFNKLT